MRIFDLMKLINEMVLVRACELKRTMGMGSGRGSGGEDPDSLRDVNAGAASGDGSNAAGVRCDTTCGETKPFSIMIAALEA